MEQEVEEEVRRCQHGTVPLLCVLFFPHNIW